jgi:protein-tyrosine phosphatase
MNPERAEPTTYNLLFVCTGNTCRSPMAAALARHALEVRGWRHVAVASAGTAALAGSPAADPVAVVLREKGIEPPAHQAAELGPDVVAWADTILAMSPAHLEAVRELGGGEKAALITDFLEGEEAGLPVLDPVGGGVEVYRGTLAQLERAVDGVLNRLAPILAP